MMLWFTGRNSLSVQCLILIAIFNHNCNSKISVLNWFPEIGRPISCNCYSFLHLSTTSQETLWWKCSLSRFTTWKKKIKSFNFSMFNLLMVVSSELYENFVYKTKEIEFKEPPLRRDFLYISFFREKCFFVSSQAWDREKILSHHEESNLRPADSEKKHLCLFLYRAQNLPSLVVLSTNLTLSTLLIQADLAHRRVSVAQWLEHRSAESEGLSEGTQNFFFVPRSCQDENTSFSISLPSSKLTISRISIYISFYRCFESIQRKYIETSFNFSFPNENNFKLLILAAFLVHSEATMGFGPSNYFEESITFWLIETLR